MKLTAQDWAMLLIAFAVFMFGVALLLHIRKEPNEAHGKFRE